MSKLKSVFGLLVMLVGLKITSLGMGWVTYTEIQEKLFDTLNETLVKIYNEVNT